MNLLSFFRRGGRKASVDDRSPWGDFWFTPVGAMSSTGQRIDPDTAMRLSAVYACVRVLSESFAVLPFRLYKTKKSGARIAVTNHWLYQLIAKAPNPYQTPFEWREMLQGHLVLRGNAFNQIIPDGEGGISALLPLHPDRVKMVPLSNGSYRYEYTDSTGQVTALARNEVWHLRGLSSDGRMGMSPIQFQSEVIASALASQDFGNRFFQNDAQPPGWIEFPGRITDESARTALQAAWQSRQGGANRGKTAILDMQMKYHEIAVNNRDSQFLESRQFSVSEIARIFRVPPHMIGDLSKATFSNIEQQSLEFVSYTMTPWAERWESSLETFLLGLDTGLEPEFDFSVLLRGDAAGRSAYYHNGILDGWLTRNEARSREGLDPLEGLDEPLRPLNMVEESQAEDEEAEGDDGADDKVHTPALPPVPSSANRLNILLQGNADRMARRIKRGQTPSAEVLSGALAIPLENAAVYLAQLPEPAGLTMSESDIVASLLTLTLGSNQ
jgi:HK97 family phage portal protein